MIYRWLSAAVGVLYVVMGGFVFYYKNFVVPLEDIVAYSLGTLLVVYGFFRVVRVIKKYNQKNENV